MLSLWKTWTMALFPTAESPTIIIASSIYHKNQYSRKIFKGKICYRYAEFSLELCCLHLTIIVLYPVMAQIMIRKSNAMVSAMRVKANQPGTNVLTVFEALPCLHSKCDKCQSKSTIIFHFDKNSNIFLICLLLLNIRSQNICAWHWHLILNF